MPIEMGIWKLGGKNERVSFEPMPSEKRLEDMLAKDTSILDPNLLLIGRQVPTLSGRIDLLAMDADGKLVVIELKRDKTPRSVVAQLLDYGSWVSPLGDVDVVDIFANYLKEYPSQHAAASLDEAFQERFKINETPESWNGGHKLVVVASELDESTERIINYLSGEPYGVPINAVFFRFFKDGDDEYLARTWLIDPSEAEAVVGEHGQEPWNDEFYVSFGDEENRRWSDARKHGYIAAGGGYWYRRTLKSLEAGSRIWVNVPGRGYVGVGNVLDNAKPITEFTLTDASGSQVPIQQMVTNTPSPNKPEDQLEYYVRVEWIHAVSLEEAVKEKGFFGNQNIVVKPKDKRWRHTVERLKKRWEL